MDAIESLDECNLMEPGHAVYRLLDGSVSLHDYSLWRYQVVGRTPFLSGLAIPLFYELIRLLRAKL